MPIDPSLIQRFMASQQPVQMPDPMANAAKLMQLQGMMDERKMQQMQMRQQSQQMAENEQLKQDFAAAGGDPEAIKSALMKRGRVKEAKEISTAALAEQKAQHEAQKSKLELATGLGQKQLSVLLSAKDAIAKNPASAQQVWDQAKASMKANADEIGVDTSKTDDPIEFPGMEFLSTKIGNLTSLKDRLEQQKNAADAVYKTWQMQHGERELAATISNQKAMQGIAAAGVSGQPFEAVDPTTGKPILVQQDKFGNLRKVEGLLPKEPVQPKSKADPNAAMGILSEAEDLVKKAPSSYAGAGLMHAGRFIGYSSNASKANAKLQALQASLMMNLPRMEGPQSDKDVALYREQAGRIGDPTLPAGDKLAAIETIKNIVSKYRTGASKSTTPSLAPNTGAASVDELLKDLGH